jgi:hypothetical protein
MHRSDRQSLTEPPALQLKMQTLFPLAATANPSSIHDDQHAIISLTTARQLQLL